MPDLTLTADNQGMVRLGHNPFTSGGPVVPSDSPGGNANGVVLLRVEHQAKVGTSSSG